MVWLASALKHPKASSILVSSFPIDVEVSIRKIMSANGMHCAVVTVVVAVDEADVDCVVVADVVRVEDTL